MPSLAEQAGVEEPGRNAAHKFLIQPSNFLDVYTCPTAQSFLGQEPDGQAWLIIGTGCGRWSCGFCARTKIRKLAYLTHGANPNRLLTLTVDPTKHADPRAAFDATRAFVPELIRALRVRFGEVEYLRVTETTRAGWPHYHLLLRSSYLPHAVVKSLWQQYTQATIVDIRQVHKSWSAYAYLVKYLTKMSNLQWTERHVSYSKNFFRPEDTEKVERPKLQQTRHDPRHPHQLLCEVYPDVIAEWTGPLRYRVPFAPTPNVTEIDPASLGLPRPPDSPYWPKVQQALPAASPEPAADYQPDSTF